VCLETLPALAVELMALELKPLAKMEKVEKLDGTVTFTFTHSNAATFSRV